MASKMIRVRVQARQTVHFDNIIQITKEDWEKWKKNSESDMAEILQDYLSLDAHSTCDAIESDFEIEVVDARGKPHKSGDKYEGPPLSDD